MTESETRQVDWQRERARSLGGARKHLRRPVIRVCHRAYDTGRLDLLPHLEPVWRAQLAHAVGHVGLLGALRRISRERTPGGEHDFRCES